ncbi:helix-turn-helix domain-containing protein [Pseudoroseicyclus sp. H15]
MKRIDPNKLPLKAMPDIRAITPRLLPSPLAAAYLGVSESTLRTLSIPRKELGAKRLYERADLDAYADALPYEHGGEGSNTCDGAFGKAS